MADLTFQWYIGVATGFVLGITATRCLWYFSDRYGWRL